MSYSIRNQKYVSHLTGKSFVFTRDRDGASKRKALAALTADERAYKDAKSRASRCGPRSAHTCRQSRGRGSHAQD